VTESFLTGWWRLYPDRSDDDLVILSESQAGLQISLNKLEKYCYKWQLTVNTNKTKLMNNLQDNSRFIVIQKPNSNKVFLSLILIIQLGHDYYLKPRIDRRLMEVIVI
jgi:hypothetical protein